jgi:hypothetical protein
MGRRAKRIDAHLKTHWETASGEHHCVIKDISQGGCFLITKDEVAVGHTVRVEIGFPNLLHMRVKGIVVRRVPNIGVGICFNSLTTTEKTLLSRVIENSRQRLDQGASLAANLTAA